MVGKSGGRTTELCSRDTRPGSQQCIAGSDGRCDEGSSATERDQLRRAYLLVRQFPFQEPRYFAKYAEALRKAGFAE